MPRYVWRDGGLQLVSDKIPAKGTYHIQESTLRQSVLDGYRKADERIGGYRGGWRKESIKRAWGVT